ncbi:hypothetical protein ACVJGD_008024 [Bradyrhizobium sp. USDA 10063]
MAEIETLLEGQLQSLGRSVLRGGGSVKTGDAKAHAVEQYKQFNERRRAVRQAQVDEAIARLKQQEKALPKSKGQREN